MPCRATQDEKVMVESSDKMWSTGEGNGKQLQYSFFENPMNSMRRQKDRTLKDECPRLVDANMLLEMKVHTCKAYQCHLKSYRRNGLGGRHGHQ